MKYPSRQISLENNLSFILNQNILTFCTLNIHAVIFYSLSKGMNSLLGVNSQYSLVFIPSKTIKIVINRI